MSWIEEQPYFGMEDLAYEHEQEREKFYVLLIGYNGKEYPINTAFNSEEEAIKAIKHYKGIKKAQIRKGFPY